MVRAKLTVQINPTKTKLRLVLINQASTGDYRRSQRLGSAILLFKKYRVVVDFQTVVFCRNFEVIAETGLENAMVGDMMWEKMDTEV